MSPTAERVKQRLAAVQEVLPEMFHESALVRFRAIIEMRKMLEQTTKMLSDLEAGTETAAIEEWEKTSEARRQQ